MRARPYHHNPFKEVLLRVILGTAVDSEAIHTAYRSLKPRDRDCMRYVPRMLQFVEG